tara:strand:- start:813 stop:1169 length:357 start_codon:yes stop_codon:yes gene_type:complete
MSRFAAIPEVPQGDIPLWQSVLFSILKENVELLTATRGEFDEQSRAVVRGDITADAAPIMTLVQITARGEGFTISGSDVAGLADFVRLISDVDRLAVDVANLRDTVNHLVANLKSEVI